MRTILITGINGFLGSHLAKALSCKYNIIGLEYSLRNLFRIANCNYKIYSTENGIPESMFIENTIDIIVHTATLYGKNEDHMQLFETNLHFPLDILNKAILYGCQLFINTDTALDRFVSEYSLTKHQFQEWLYLLKNKIRIINMELEHFYGSGASHANFITAMFNKLKSNESPINLTLGEQERNFIYIDDVVDSYLTVIEKYSIISDKYSHFQVCTNQTISIRELLKLMREISGSSSILNFGAIPYRENELMHSKTNNSALVALGWNPRYTLLQGLKLTCYN